MEQLGEEIKYLFGKVKEIPSGKLTLIEESRRRRDFERLAKAYEKRAEEYLSLNKGKSKLEQIPYSICAKKDYKKAAEMYRLIALSYASEDKGKEVRKYCDKAIDILENKVNRSSGKVGQKRRIAKLTGFSY